MFKIYLKVNCDTDDIPYVWTSGLVRGQWVIVTKRATQAEAEKEVAWMQNELDEWDVDFKIEEDGNEIWRSKK